jgi:glycosyltransferase involved in cell wall biosynthesis
VVLHALLTSLTPRHQVTLVTATGPEPDEWAAVEQLRAQGLEVHAVRLMQPHPSPGQRWGRRWQLASAWLLKGYPWRTAWFWEPGVQSALDRLAGENRFDLIQVEDNSMGAYCYPSGLPTVFTEHEVRRPRALNWRPLRQRGLVRWAFDEADWRRWPRYERGVWRRFDSIQVFTARDALSIQSIAPDVSSRVRVNPFGVALPPPADPAREQAGTLLFVGNFTHPPNVDAALWLGREIMPHLRGLRDRHLGLQPSLRSRLQLNLVGIYPPAAVQALACDDIAVTGPVPDILPYMEGAEVVLAPVRIGGGMRMKVLQAMAMGKAVVTTPRGAEGLAVEGSQPPLVVAEDAGAIAAAVESLLGSPDARHTLGGQARAFVNEHYSPAAYARRLEAIYAELLPNGVTA